MPQEIDLSTVDDAAEFIQRLSARINALNKRIEILEQTSRIHVLTIRRREAMRTEYKALKILKLRLGFESNNTQSINEIKLIDIPKSVRNSDAWKFFEKAAELDINHFQKDFNPLFRFDKFGTKVKEGIAGPVGKRFTVGCETMADWNRLFDIIHINGKTLSSIRQNLHFNDINEFRDFIEQLLLAHIDDDKLRAGATLDCLEILHQNGLPFATNSVMFPELAQLISRGLIIDQPKTFINLVPCNNGLQVYEKETYDTSTKQIAGEKNVTKIKLQNDDFYVQTKTHSRVTWTMNESNKPISTIKVDKLSVRCNDDFVRQNIELNLKPQSLFESICRYLKHALGNAGHIISNFMPSFDKNNEKQEKEKPERRGPTL